MKSNEKQKALATAVKAAKAAGQVMRLKLRADKKVEAAIEHDIKLELDTLCQNRIERILLSAFPQIAILGEEGVAGDSGAPARWVVDPIDGTVNFAYGIPHACVAIALQERQVSEPNAEFQTILGVIFDPFCNELWTAIRGQQARLNGRIIRVSRRNTLRECIVSLGFAKYRSTLQRMLPSFQHLVHRVRKMRIMGSAALDLAYVATGRMDAYIESGVRLWDIAAGGIILECAGGEFWHTALPEEYTYHVVATNGLLRRRIEKFIS